MSFIGVGNILNYYFVKSDGTTIQQEFKYKIKHKIHGICYRKKSDNLYDIIIYGGREFMLISLVNVSIYSGIYTCSQRFIHVAPSFKRVMRLEYL